VSKAPNPADARGTVVTLSDSGRAELGRVRRLHGERVAALVDAHPDLTTDDLATAVAVLRGVLESTSLQEGTP
jgi:DNA-binding MarR family transcriptional regulator